ncbi:hypothetical protein C5167_022720 [Papaver somniferum]|uniref:FAR1 domain-containing protein n=1 Tax=Papaver somniferum TaxID=3469 RepID=A0A4Y7JIR0_PAPSO|nr:hypothetical protein C5167_022720 [Papaver somniferum]
MEETSSGNPSLEIVVSQENDGNEAIIDENDSTKKNKEAEIDNVGNKELEEPKVGMLFGTADEVLEYYKNYAKQLGFPVKKRSSTKDDDGVLRYEFQNELTGKMYCDLATFEVDAQRCDKMEKSFNEIKEMANDSEDKCVIVMSWMNKLKEELINHDYKSIRVTPKLPIPRILGNNVKSIPKEGQSMLSPNYLYGSNGTGNVALPIPIIYDNRFQGHHHQAWNGVYSMFSLPSSNLQGLGNQKPD